MVHRLGVVAIVLFGMCEWMEYMVEWAGVYMWLSSCGCVYWWVCLSGVLVVVVLCVCECRNGGDAMVRAWRVVVVILCCV